MVVFHVNVVTFYSFRVRNRPCEGVRCDGIVVALTLYPHTNPYQSQLKTTSPVMDVTLRQPEDGN